METKPWDDAEPQEPLSDDTIGQDEARCKLCRHIYFKTMMYPVRLDDEAQASMVCWNCYDKLEG